MTTAQLRGVVAQLITNHGADHSRCGGPEFFDQDAIVRAINADLTIPAIWFRDGEPQINDSRFWFIAEQHDLSAVSDQWVAVKRSPTFVEVWHRGAGNERGLRAADVVRDGTSWEVWPVGSPCSKGGRFGDWRRAADAAVSGRVLA